MDPTINDTVSLRPDLGKESAFRYVGTAEKEWFQIPSGSFEEDESSAHYQQLKKKFCLSARSCHYID
jgi:hypothetical protein